MALIDARLVAFRNHTGDLVHMTRIAVNSFPRKTRLPPLCNRVMRYFVTTPAQIDRCHGRVNGWPAQRCIAFDGDACHAIVFEAMAGDAGNRFVLMMGTHHW